MRIGFDRTFDRLAPRGAFLAGASLIAALALGPPSALAACGGLPSTGAHSPSTGNGGVHVGATMPHVSTGSGGGGCPTTAPTNNVKTMTLNGTAHFSSAGGTGGHTWTHSANNWHSNSGTPHTWTHPKI